MKRWVRMPTGTIHDSMMYEVPAALCASRPRNCLWMVTNTEPPPMPSIPEAAPPAKQPTRYFLRTSPSTLISGGSASPLDSIRSFSAARAITQMSTPAAAALMTRSLTCSMSMNATSAPITAPTTAVGIPFLPLFLAVNPSCSCAARLPRATLHTRMSEATMARCMSKPTM